MKEKINVEDIPFLFKPGTERILTPLKFLLNPANIFNKAIAQNLEIFQITMGSERWIFLTGEEGTRYFGQLKIEDVDTFEFRARMYTLELPGAEPPSQLPEISRSTNKVINGFFTIMPSDDITAFLLAKIQNYIQEQGPKSGVIENLHSFIIRLSSTIFANLFLGEEAAAELPKDFYDQYVTVGESLYILPLIVPFFKPNGRRTNEAKRKIVAGFQKVLDAVKDPNSKIKLSPVLTGYLEIQKEYGLPDQNLIWLLNAFLWASIHYTSVHSLWTCAETLTHNKFLDNVMSEIPQSTELTIEDIHRNEYLENLILENIRSHSVFALPRRVKHNLEYKRYSIPQGTILAISPYLEHHKPENFAHPHALDPNRWNDKSAREHFLPGGLGFFGCIGMALAVNFMKSLFSVLFKNYHLELIGEPPKLKERLILLPPKKPVRIKISKK